MSREAVLGHLDALGVAYELVECDPDFADTARFCERYGFPMEASANAICVVGKSAERPMACCVVLASTRLDVNGVVRRRLGTRKASFADAEATVERTGMMIGGVTPYDDSPSTSAPSDAPHLAQSPSPRATGRPAGVTCPHPLDAPLGVGERAFLLRERRCRQHDIGQLSCLVHEDVLDDEEVELVEGCLCMGEIGFGQQRVLADDVHAL